MQAGNASLETAFWLALPGAADTISAVKRLQRSILPISMPAASRIVCLFCAALLAASALAQEQKPPATLAELRQRVAHLIGQPKYASAMWGAKIVSLDSGDRKS